MTDCRAGLTLRAGVAVPGECLELAGLADSALADWVAGPARWADLGWRAAAGSGPEKENWANLNWVNRECSGRAMGMAGHRVYSAVGSGCLARARRRSGEPGRSGALRQREEWRPQHLRIHGASVHPYVVSSIYDLCSKSKTNGRKRRGLRPSVFRAT